MTKPHPSLENKLHQWASLARECSKCDISKYCTHKVYHLSKISHPSFTTMLPSRVDILFIGEAPGQSEYNESEPFIGQSGQVLRSIIEEAVPKHVTYTITNSILCTPFTDHTRYDIRAPSLSEIRECAGWLTTLCRKIRPKKVIAVGNVAEKSIKFIRMKIPLPEHIQIRHPSFIMRSSKFDYEFDNAVLQIQEYINDL